MPDTKTIQIDQEIPDFDLEAFHNEEIKSVKLSDYRGKWLVSISYPADFTSFALRNWKR